MTTANQTDPFDIPGPFDRIQAPVTPTPVVSPQSPAAPSLAESRPEPAVTLAALPADQQQKALALAKQIDVKNPQTLLQYGLPVQSELSRFADNILDHVRAKDSGTVGEVLGNLMQKLKEANPDDLLESKDSFFNKFFSSAKRSAEKVLARYQTLGSEIDQISLQLDKARLQLLRDITLLETLFHKNREYFNELNVYIAAAQHKLEELRNQTIPQLQQRAAATNDTALVQELNDHLQFVDRLEKKVHDLLISRTVTLQTAPQIRLIQNNDHVLVEKIQSSILTTIPLWKNQIVLALTLQRQQAALAMQRQVADTTNELLLRNSEMLKTNTIGVARENERAIVDMATLKKTQENLMNTLEETLKIQQEGRVRRREAEAELARLEQELKNRMAAMVIGGEYR
ncbi:toxic ion resistance protein [Heliomicrobium modesticaldum Ice1]|uniref:Toxic ion resistance protein n=1 Tax=Heliobacterium modesticaldum (strain ATCC 51547 / Ice1) TaxID=498761 RepID=B0THW0_HELMI|nr:toxic anion resistance protein [Heliomicrobium modesticaldum]ABZ82633.1 toxic ion resistance protein [Heliomicrobium modesticaldum Ice1]